MNNKIELRFEHVRAFSFLQGQIPDSMVDELNKYIDSKEGGKEFELVNDNDIIKGLESLLTSASRTFMSSYSQNLPISTKDGAANFSNVDVTCDNLRVFNSYKNEYHHPVDNDLDYTNRNISITSIMNLKIPDGIQPKSGETETNEIQGHTHFVWGVNTFADQISLKPKQEKIVTPVVGRFILFPSWLKYNFLPFFCEGNKRIITANHKISFESEG